MTTIAYRDGFLAADTLTTAGCAVTGETSKITRNQKGDLAGFAGTATVMAEMQRWFLAGGGPAEEARFARGGGLV